MSKESRISNEGKGSNRNSNNKPPHKNNHHDRNKINEDSATHNPDELNYHKEK